MALILAAAVRINFGGLLCFGVSILGVLIFITMLQHRRHAAATDVKMCPGCSTPNPLHAAYCRNCGKKL